MTMTRFAYNVFLSFRGNDTRKTFTDHLYTALVSAGIHIFRDDDELEKGEDVASGLLKAIEGSRVSIVVLSKLYASSGWCLDELIKILECKKNLGQFVLPIFYDVDPVQVRLQTGSFAEAFARHEERINAESELERKTGKMEKMKHWRAALVEVAGLQEGMILQNQHDGYEAKFIEDVVKEIERRLGRTILRTAPYPVGIDSRVKDIESWLLGMSNNASILVMYGIGGIGKTTIAKTVYNLHYDKFEASSFLLNIREISEHTRGLVRLQRQLLSDILRKKAKKTYNVNEGTINIKNAICCRRILLVLDDVDDLDQLNAILGAREWFHQGSKIIITTRHKRLLVAQGTYKMYKVKELDDIESLQLFSLHAFKQARPAEEYWDLSRNVVKHCGGIPLALQVLGSSLYLRSLDTWESAIRKLRVIPDSQILKKLRISYDSLPDDHDKNVFLDIACFFLGKDKDCVIAVLDLDFYPVSAIQNLIDRCMLSLEEDNKLMMHQLLRDMGREIARQESPHPGKRSRVWNHKDSFNVLARKMGTNRIRGLILDMKRLKENKTPGTLFSMHSAEEHHSEQNPDDIALETNSFEKMHKLRLLQLSFVHLTGHYLKFPKKIGWLNWRGFPLKFIHDDFPLQSVVVIDMRYSRLEQVWKGTRFLGSLKILNLSHSHALRRTPDFTGLPNLHVLVLKDCLRLVEIHESIGSLQRLVFLNLRDCRNLLKLPASIGQLKSLQKLILSGCSKLQALPMELCKLESLTTFHADEITLNHSASSGCLVKPWHSRVWSWARKPIINSQTDKLLLGSLSRSLVSLSLVKCNVSDDLISISLAHLSALHYLNLTENPIRTLPQSIINLPIQEIWLDACPDLHALPQLPNSLVKLKTIDCKSLIRITNLPNMLGSLYLDVTGCGNLVEVQELFKLENISNFSTEMINSLDYLELDAVKDIKVELFNKLTDTRTEVPLQGLYEFGIFSTWVPGNEVSNQLKSDGTQSSLSLKLSPPGPRCKITGLNTYIVYTRSSYKRFKYWSDANSFSYYIKVVNKTKGLKWVYGPTMIGIPGNEEDMTMLSHWNIGHQLEAGDEVNVSVVGITLTFRIKKFGAAIVYNVQEIVDNESINESNLDTATNTMIDHDHVSEYQLRPCEFFLSHPEYFVLKGSTTDRAVRSILHEQLFEDQIEASGSNNEMEVGESEEDDFDYPLIEESDVLDEVEELLDNLKWWKE